MRTPKLKCLDEKHPLIDVAETVTRTAVSVRSFGDIMRGALKYCHHAVIVMDEDTGLSLIG